MPEESIDDAMDKAERVIEFCQSEKQTAERDLAVAQDAPGDTPAALNYKGALAASTGCSGGSSSGTSFTRG